MNNNDIKGKKRQGRIWIIVCMLCLFNLFPLKVYCQIADIPTIEAFIYNHRKIRSMLVARNAVETSNEILHKASMVTNRKYKDINTELDKYTKVFDIVDLIINSLATGYNVYDVGKTIKNRIVDYKNILKRYHQFVIHKNNIETADTTIVITNLRAINDIQKECQYIYGYMGMLIAYSTGKIKCTPASYIIMVDYINESLTRIKDIINAAYFRTWQFINLRTTFWKRELYRSKPIKIICDDQFTKWKQRGYSIKVNK